MKTVMILCCLFFINTAEAGPRLKDYADVKNDEKFQIYIFGIGEGYGIANVDIEIRGQRPFFCPPDKLALNKTNYLNILDKYINSPTGQKEPSDTPLEFLLIEGLKQTFPCH